MLSLFPLEWTKKIRAKTRAFFRAFHLFDTPQPTMNDHQAATATSTPAPVSRDGILQQLFDQATSVRCTFEESSYNSSAKRKHAVSSATAASAHHMASLNRKRKFEHRFWTASAGGGPAVPAREITVPSQVCFKQARHTFHSPNSRYTWSGEGQSQQQQQAAPPPAPTSPVVEGPRAAQPPEIFLSAYPADITLTYNAVVCGSGATTSSLVGNQRFKVWIDAHKSSFARSTSLYQDIQIARSVVYTVMSSVPPGQFLSMDMHTGFWYDVGYERSVEIALDALVADTTEGRMLAETMKKLNGVDGGTIKHTAASDGGTKPPVVRTATVHRVLTSKAA